MPGIDERVRKLLEEGLIDRDEIVDRILGDTDRDELVAMVRPVVSWQVSHRLRHLTRRREEAAFKVVDPKLPNDKATVFDELKNLLDATFVLEDGERVTWGEATVEQHQRRATMLRNHAERVGETANRHERAAWMISEADVSCLADLYAPKKRQRQKKAA